MKNGDHAIGLFQGMFERNILTFNPGWDSDAQPPIVHGCARAATPGLKAQGLHLVREASGSAGAESAGVLIGTWAGPGRAWNWLWRFFETMNTLLKKSSAYEDLR